jgi:hypothetical protein
MSKSMKSTKSTTDVADEDDSSAVYLSSGDSTTNGLEEMFLGSKFTETPMKAKPPPTPASGTSNKSCCTPPIGKNSIFDLVGDGTRERPWRIPVNPKYPELYVPVHFCEAVCPFDI